MPNKSTVDILFKEHSYEEVESVRDNLAGEIEKRTELLKSIVKEKYQDVVDTSDAIQAMKIKLPKLETSITQFETSILKFYSRIDELNIQTKRSVKEVESVQVGRPSCDPEDPPHDESKNSIAQVLSMSAEIWDHFDSGNYGISLKLYNDCMVMLKQLSSENGSQQEMFLLKNMNDKLIRIEQMMKNFLWYKIQSAEPNQIGIIAGSNEEDLYSFSFRSSIECLVEKLRNEISDMSYQAQLRRYQQYSYFNTTTNAIDNEVDDMKPPSSDHVQIPKAISIELSAFLFDLCRVINTITGFSLTRSSILNSLKLTMLHILDVYTGLKTTIDTLNGGSKRRQAMQLYYDLMYIRVLLNTSKDFELIDELDIKVSTLMSKYEQELDTIELYIVSDALHTNVSHLSKSTIRLYGLLVPYLH